MSLLGEQCAFYTERVPTQFNRTLESQRVAARTDPEAARLLEEMEAVRTSIIVEIDAGEVRPRHVFDIERGEMQVTQEPARPPFMVLKHSLADFPNLRQECGDSLLGFLGGLAGLGDEMRLTSQRVRSLRELAGSLDFERIGPGGFVLHAHFGAGEPTPSPRTTIRIDANIYEKLQSGRLDPQDAFLDGLIDIEGDLEMAIGLALTAASPE